MTVNSVAMVSVCLLSTASQLLASDGKPDALIGETLHIGVRTVERTRQKFIVGV